MIKESSSNEDNKKRLQNNFDTNRSGQRNEKSNDDERIQYCPDPTPSPDATSEEPPVDPDDQNGSDPDYIYCEYHKDCDDGYVCSNGICGKIESLSFQLSYFP